MRGGSHHDQGGYRSPQTERIEEENVSPQAAPHATLSCLPGPGQPKVWAMLRLPGQGMPYQCFKLLKERRADELLNDWPECMLDSLTAALRKKFPDPEALKGDECQAIAEVLMMMFDIDIADIECRHAQTRDHSKIRARAWVPSLETLAAKFALRGSNHRRYNPEDERGSWKKKPPKKKAKGGGAWRAFIHLHAEGVRNATELSVKHRHLSREERSRLELAGSIATAAHREGLPSFGARAKASPESSRPAPLPGTLLGEAVVAADQQPMSMFEAEERSLNFYAGPTFEEHYARWKQEQHQQLADSKRESEREAQLAKFAKEVQDLPLAKQASDIGPGFLSSEQFDRFPCALRKLQAFRWLPNISQMVQAGRAL